MSGMYESYQRPSAWLSPTVWIIGINGILYVLSSFFIMLLGIAPILSFMIFSFDAFEKGRYWELFTYMWVHAPLMAGGGAGILHIAFNMLTLWMFGRVLERDLGAIPFLLLYVLGGVMSALCFCADFFLRHDLSIHAYPPVLMGASGAVCAVVAAFSLLHPNVRLVLFLLPFPVKARNAVLGFLVVSIVLMFSPWLPFIAHSAHIGGILTGYAWVFLLGVPRRVQQRVIRMEPGAVPPVQGPAGSPEELKKELELIARKIEREGVHSLTERELMLISSARPFIK